MKVLVTGSEGFIGKPTCKLLEENGHEVIPFDLEVGRDLEVPSHFEGLEYDSVIHLAAVSSTPWARDCPRRAFTTNVFGTYILLCDCVMKKAKRFVYASSYRVKDLPVDNPYVVSKKLEEEVVNIFRTWTDITGLRYTSVYGPEGPLKTHSVNILNQIIESAMRCTEVIIHGDGTQFRDFVYVDDVARANLEALLADKTGTFDIGSGSGTSLREAIRAVETLSGKKVNAKYIAKYPSDYMMSQAAESLVTKCNIGFVTQVDLPEGIRRCIASY